MENINDKAKIGNDATVDLKPLGGTKADRSENQESSGFKTTPKFDPSEDQDCLQEINNLPVQQSLSGWLHHFSCLFTFRIKKHIAFLLLFYLKC